MLEKLIAGICAVLLMALSIGWFLFYSSIPVAWNVGIVIFLIAALVVIAG